MTIFNSAVLEGCCNTEVSVAGSPAIVTGVGVVQGETEIIGFVLRGECQMKMSSPT